MPFCRRCGTKLDENAHFCHKCGTIVETYLPPPPPSMKLIRNDPIIIASVVLSVILVVGVVVFAFLSTPFSTVNFNQNYQDNSPNINKLNLNVQIDGAKVNVFTQNINNTNFILTLKGTGSKGIFDRGNDESPIQVAFYNDTANGVLTMTTNITKSTAFSRFNMECNIYLNPAIKLNLNVTSKAGQISLTADKPATFDSLNLQANSGSVQANLQNVTIAGNVTLRTQSGTVDFRTNQIKLEGNNSIDLHSNAGSINMDLTQTKNLQGNLQINATTNLGSMNVGLVIDGNVGAKIISQTNLGSINTDKQHFSGNQSPIQSDNYPAISNIEINSQTNLGSININAVYQSSVAPSIRN